MRRVWSGLFFALLILGFTACGEDNTSEQEEGNDWNLGDDAGFGDADDNGENSNVGNEDANTDPGENTSNNNDEQPLGLVPEALIGNPWYGVFRITDDPAITGLYTGVQFVDEETVIIHSEPPREGEWTILESEDVLLHDLEQVTEEPQPEQLMLMADLVDEEVVALELSVPAEHVEPYRARFEQQGDAAIGIGEIIGRWQSTEMLTTAEGNDHPLALRFDSGGIAELGVVAENNNFFGFTSGAGRTHTLDTGETFWALEQGEGVEGHPVAGEIFEIDGELKLYMFSETAVEVAEEPEDSEMELRVYEMEQVENFSYQ